MKLKNIFGKNGTLLMGAAMAFTVASCNTDTKSNQSIVREVEEEYDDSDINEPDVAYENGEYVDEEGNVERVAAGEENYLKEPGYNYDKQYGYDEKELVEEKLRTEIERADRAVKDIERRLEAEGEKINLETRERLENARTELEAKRTELNNNLEELGVATEENWDKVRIRTNQALEEFGSEWNELSQDVEIDTEEGYDN